MPIRADPTDLTDLAAGNREMCLVIALWRPDQEFSFILAANRDESYARRGEPPRLLNPSPKIWGGRDPVAGGTWLGLNEHGLVVALTDGPTDDFEPSRRSRGLLCLDALKSLSASDLQVWLGEETRERFYNAFSLLWYDGKACLAAHWSQRTLRMETLSPGLHFLANTPAADDMGVPKIRHCRRRLEGVADSSPETVIQVFAEVCAAHGASRDEAACIHDEEAGTLSSSILALHRSGVAASRYLHAESHPCLSKHVDVSGMLAW
jgi:uncharacterized protein with NRDE domain